MPVEMATFVFTDLVDSTAMASALSPQGADRLRRIHVELVGNAIEGAGGTVVKNLGDGVMAVFSSASRAVAAGVAIQQAIDRHNRRGEQPLAVRVGIATGEATAEAGDFFGEPVVEAARLCAAAAGGEVLCTEVVRVVAGRHLVYDTVDRGAMELKGLPRSVPVFEVRWYEENDGDVPLPARLVASGSAGLFSFHGRSGELARIDDARKASFHAAELRVVLLVGEPGIGKTSLAAHAARAAHAEGAVVLFGGCVDGLAVPYGPWVVALTHLVEHADASMLPPTVVSGPLGRLLAMSRHEFAAPTEGADPATERFLLLEAVTRLLEEVSSVRPVVIIFDDLQWADTASLQTLRHLVASSRPLRVLVVGTFRDSDLSADAPLLELLADFHRVPSIERIVLSGLSDSEVVDLVEAASGRPLSEQGVALAHAVWQESDGNPFFVGELLRHLGESDAVVRDRTGVYGARDALGEIRLPTSIREVVARRVGRLGAEATRLLTVAAISGVSFEVTLVADVAGAREDEVLDVLERATAAGIVAEDPDDSDRYRFVHALIAHTLEAGISAARRRRLHERIAQSLEARQGRSTQEVAELARHWLAAVRPTDVTKARDYAGMAGDAALDALAPADAARWYEQALELVTAEEAHERCRLLIRLADARRQSGDSWARDTLREAATLALRLGDRDLLVGASLAFRDPNETQSETDPERIALVEAALGTLSPGEDVLRSLLLARLSEVIDPRDWRRRQDLAEQAIDAARASGDPAALRDAITYTFDARNRPDNLDVRLADTALALELAEQTSDVWVKSQALNNRMTVLIEAGQLEEGDAVLRRLESLAAETGLPGMEFQWRLTRTALTLLEGDLVRAEQEVMTTHEAGLRAGSHTVDAAFGVQLLEIREQQGRLEELLPAYEAVAAANPAIASMRARLTDVYSQVGRTEDARQVLLADLSDGFNAYPLNVTWLGSMCRCADAATFLGEREAAAELQARLLPFADRVACNPSAILGPVARPLGRLAALLGDHSGAAAYLDAALATARRWRAPYQIARILVERAEALRPDPAAINEASTIIDRHGYAGLKRRLDSTTRR